MNENNKSKDDTGMGKITKWVPLAALAFASAAAWGSQQTTTAAHERRIANNEKLLQVLMEGQSRIEERTQISLVLIREIRNRLDRKQ